MCSLDTQFCACAATLISTPTVACPDDTVTFTCTLPGAMGVNIRWTVVPPPGLNLANAVGSVSNTFLTSTIGSDGFMFRADYSGFSGGMITSTLTSITIVTALARSMVQCEVGAAVEDPILITLAGECLNSVTFNCRRGNLNQE